MPKICQIDNNNVNTTLYAAIYYPIVCSTSNLTGIDSISFLESNQNNLDNHSIVLRVTPSQSFARVSFELTFPNVLMNAHFNINGYTESTHYPIHDTVVYSSGDSTLTVSMTSRMDLNPFILVIKN